MDRGTESRAPEEDQVNGIKCSIYGNLGKDAEIQGDKVKLNVAVRMSAEHTEWVSVTLWPTKNGGGLDYWQTAKKGGRVAVLGATLVTKPGDKGVWWNASAQALDAVYIPKQATDKDAGDLPF